METFDSPKPTKKVKFGWKQIKKKTPATAKRIGVAFTALATYGLAQTYVQGHSWLNDVFIIAGGLGVFLTAMFGEE